jgi:signal transduction histidine kinase/DNA-binding response OmpR family regulator/ligand-binding sensor domain-containing protein
MKRLYLILVFSYLITIPGFGQEPNIFKNIDTESLQVNSIFQDKYGLVWFGTTNGLLRMDEFENNNGRLNRKKYIINEYVKDIQGDAEGRLWIHTGSSKYVVYNQRNNFLSENNSEVKKQIPGIDIQGNFTIYIDENKSFWLYNETRLYFCDSSRQETIDIETENNYISTKDITSLIVKNGDCYVLHQTGVIDIFEIAGFRFKNRITTPYPVVFSDNIVVDDQLNIWLRSELKVNCYSQQLNKWVSIDESNNTVYRFILPSGNGNTWIATEHGGILIYDSDLKLKQKLVHDPYINSSLLSNSVYTIYKDGENNMWIGYVNHGVSFYCPLKQEYYNKHLKLIQYTNQNDPINVIRVDKQNKIWFGTDGFGLIVKEPNSEKEYIYEPANKIKPSDNNVVTSLFIDSRERIWVGRYKEGVTCFADGRTTKYILEESPWSIVEDEEQNIWIGTLGAGLYRIDSKTGKTQNFKLINNEISSNYILELCYGTNNKLYIATGWGLNIFDTKTFKNEILHGNRTGTKKLSYSRIQSVFYDSRGLIWLICSMGQGVLNLYDPFNDNIVVFNDLYDYDIKSIIEDDNKNIWLSTDKGIVNIVVGYEPQTGKYTFSNYSYLNNDNIYDKNYFSYRSVAKDKTGNIYFGGVNGYSAFNPKSIMANRNVDAKLLFTSLKINNNFIKVDSIYNGEIILRKSIEFTDKIELNYKNNNISLDFLTLNYSAPFKTNYYYQLKGLDDNWNPIIYNNISLANLMPGKYMLFVKAMDNSGRLSKNLTQLEIVINPPIWQSYKAYIFYELLLAGIILFAYLTIKRKNKQKLQIQRMEMEAERQTQINDMKIRFFTNINHDFRTPLSLISMPLEELIANTNDKNLHEKLTLIYKNAVRLLNLVNQALDLKKLDIINVKLNLSYGDIVSFTNEICSSFILFSESTQKIFEVNSSVKSLEMLFDKDKISKVIMNILSNAFKFTPEEGAIKVSISLIDKNVEIRVSDTGPGIADNEKEKVFERFYQIDRKTVKNNGSGIGLHIAKEFIELHSGKIKIEDNKPEGSVFVISIPVLKDKPIITKPNEVNIEIQLEEEIKKNGSDYPVILIVEDNVEFMQFITDSLAEEYKTIKALNGKEALQIIKESSVDIIISDVMMPEIDGFELCKILKNSIETSHIPIILLTAKVLADDELKGLELGADDYVTKPFNLSVLKLKIKHFIEYNKRSHEVFRKKAEINPSEITITSLDEKLLTKAISIVENNISDPDFSVEMLSEELGMHRTQLYKKLMFITGKSPVEFIRLLRLKRAKHILSKSQMYVSEVAYEVGFNTPRLFAKYFKEEFSISPSDFIKTIDSQKTNFD